MEKLVLANIMALGDVIVLSGALRDLHLCYPERFQTGVRTYFPDLWRHNPYVASVSLDDPEARLVPCTYPAVHECNQRPVHLLDGFIEEINWYLGTAIRPTALRGDLYLSEEEKQAPSRVQELLGEELPFWIVVAGGKFDITAKWWHIRRWQAVVDHFQGKLLFVQIGDLGHYHPPLRGVVDLRGKTTLRSLMQLIYHARGVICPITAAMHLSAAVEVKPGNPNPRPCVVVAGGREPTSWFAYPHHHVVHTLGQLPCCATGGCWKTRTVALGDGLEFDLPKNLCVDVVNGLPHCMDLIQPEQVISAVEAYECRAFHTIGSGSRRGTAMPSSRALNCC
jgi:ADP-heptose:LPS heptosyltransferase